MKYEIIGRNIEVTKAMEEHIKDRLQAIEKYFLINEDTKARIVCKVHKNDQKVEITIPTRTITLRCEVSHPSWYAAVDLAMDKLEGQIRREKTRLAKHSKKKDSFTENFVKELEAIQDTAIEDDIREKLIIMQELSLNDAIIELELSGHDFYAFQELGTRVPCIIYKRNNGGYGIMYLQ